MKNKAERLRSSQRLATLVHELVISHDVGDCVSVLKEICRAFHECARLGIRPRDAAMLLEPIKNIEPASPLIYRLRQACWG